MRTVIEFKALKSADLIKGAVYKGGQANNLSSEPISKLLPVGNQGGIRYAGRYDNPSLIVLYTTLSDSDWPDSIIGDKVTYYGDNKEPGKEIHELPGNNALRSLFNNYYVSKKQSFPPILLFSKGETGFDRIFEGLLKPGYAQMGETEDLVAVWKTKEGKRFQNYKAFLTLLPVERIERNTLLSKLKLR
jgi:hypothetical protein